MRIRPWAATAALCLLLGATGCGTNTGNNTGNTAAGDVGNAVRNGTTWAGNAAGDAGRVTGEAVRRTGNVIGAGVAGLAGAAGTAVDRAGRALTGNNGAAAGGWANNGNPLHTIQTFHIDAPNRTVHVWLNAAGDWTGRPGNGAVTGTNGGRPAADATGTIGSAAVRNGTSAGYTAGAAGTAYNNGAVVGGTGTVHSARNNTAGLGPAMVGSYSAINRGPAAPAARDNAVNWGRYNARADGYVEHSGAANAGPVTGNGATTAAGRAGIDGRTGWGTAGYAGTAAGYAARAGDGRVDGDGAAGRVGNGPVNGRAADAGATVAPVANSTVSTHVPMTITVPRGWTVHITVNNLRLPDGSLATVAVTRKLAGTPTGATAGMGTTQVGAAAGTGAQNGTELRSAGAYAGAYLGRIFVDHTQAQQAGAMGPNARSVMFKANQIGTYIVTAQGHVLETIVVNGSQNAPTISTR